MNEQMKPSPTDRILFVNIKNSFYCTDRHSEYYRPSAYEATRKYWRVAKTKVDKVNLVIGHVDGIVKEVIKPTIWKVSDNPKYPNRYECEGEEWDDSPHIGKSIRELVTLGQNPVAYYPSDKKYWE